MGPAVRDSLVAVIRVVEAVVGRKPTESSVWRDYGRMVMALDQAVHEVPPPPPPTPPLSPSLFPPPPKNINNTHSLGALCRET